MIVILTSTNDELRDGEHGLRHQYIEVRHGVVSHDYQLGEGEPEDASFCRDFQTLEEIIGMIELAHAAGKSGEALVISRVEQEGF